MQSINAYGNAAVVVPIPLTANAGAGVIGSWQNTTGRTLNIITRWITVNTTSTGAATVDAGVATTAVTSDTLIDGQALNGLAADTVVQTAGTNGANSRVLAPGSWVTAFGSAATTGLVGTMFIQVVETD
jgi:hypothetical protein